MTLRFNNLEEFEEDSERRTQRQTTGPQIEDNLVEDPTPVVEDIEVPEDIANDTTPLATDFLGGAEVPPTELEARRTRIEDAIGESVGVVGSRAHEIAASIRDGIIAKVEVGFWRARVKNTAQELGLDAALSDRLFSGLGVKLLAPKSLIGRLNSLDTQARNLLGRFGFKTAWGRFIPNQNWDRFKSEFTSLQTEFNETIEILAAKVESGELQDWVRETYAEFAQETWVRGVRDTWVEDLGEGNMQTFADVDEAPDSYITHVVNGALSRVPSPGYIRDCGRYQYRLDIVQAPDTMLATEYAGSNPDLQRELIQQMNERKSTLIDDFINSAREALLENVQGLVESVHHTLDGKRQVHGKTINKILNKLQDVRYLNVINDADFEQSIQELESYISRRRDALGSKVDPNDVLRQLNRTAASITESLTRQMQGTQQFSQIGEF
jgi:hypothetical protein